MKQRDKPYEEIYDLLAIRVLVNIGARLLPRARRHPRRVDAGAGAHQGLHRAAEVERLPVAAHDGVRSGAAAVRDPDPHARDAPHRGLRHRGALALQGGREEPDELDRHLSWFRQVLELQLDAKTPDEFLEFLKLDLYQDEIFVFTPTGDVIQLPKGATPIDFAFAVHTEVGLHCAGREGQRPHRAAVAAAAQLGDGRDHHVADRASRRRDWLAHVRTGRARHKIRQVAASAKRSSRRPRSSGRRCSIARSSAAVSRSRTTISCDARREALSLTDATHLSRRSGRATSTCTLALKQLYPGSRRDRAAEAERRSSGFVDRVRGTKGVRIQGVDGLMVRYAQCCQPVPGDPVVGYVTRGRGVSIHRADCPNLLLLAHEPERRLEIDWQEAQGERFLVRLALEGNDRRGLYADVAAAAGDTGTDISAWSSGAPTARPRARSSSRSRTSSTSRGSSRRCAR